MNKLLLACLLAISSSCSIGDKQHAELPRIATSQEMQVVRALVAMYRVEDEAWGKYTKQKAEAMPTWSRMLPLHVLHTDGLEQVHPPFNGFAVPLRKLVSYKENGRRIFALQDSTHLLRQVSKTEILLDSTAFKPDNVVTPHLYKQLKVRQKVRRYRFYRFSQPLFSPDSNSAYIQVDIAGSRESYRLSKKQGKWTVAHVALLWVE